MKIYFDFEYNQNGAGGQLHPVCVCCRTDLGASHNFWLRDEKGLSAFNEFMQAAYIQDCTLVSWNAVAEASALIALGIDPMAYHWIDLWLEYRLLMNDNYTALGIVGDHYDSDTGKIVNLKAGFGIKAKVNLESALYKMLSIKPEDKDHKKNMRNLILENNDWSAEDRKLISDYCASDVKYLPSLEKRITESIEMSLTPSDFEDYHTQKLSRADYSVLTAYMQQYGYPLNVEAAKRVVSKKDQVLNKIREDFNDHYPDFNLFLWNEKQGKYNMKRTGQGALIAYLLQKYPNLRAGWHRSETTGGYSLDSKKVLQRNFPIKNGWTKDCPGQFYHYFKTQESAFNSFKYPEDASAKDKRNVLFAKGIITDDSRVHCFMNPFGAKTARSQPKATAYIFGKPAWLRSLVQPKPGRAIIEIDYAGQELFIQGLISGDANLIHDYLSEDLYMSFAKRADSTIPRNATKKTHSEKRAMYKEVVLGIGYGMGGAALAQAITMKTGKLFKRTAAEKLILKFYKTYHRYAKWKNNTVKLYKSKGYLQLKSGWTLFGGKSNAYKVTTIPNFPIQGAGSEIMRTAVMKCFHNDLDVIFTLHDALFIECDNDRDTLQHSLQVFTKCMREAFEEYFLGDINYWLAGAIKLEAEIWSPDYKEGQKLFHATHPSPDKFKMSDGHVTGKVFLENSVVNVKPYFVDGRAIEQLKITGDIVLSEKNYKHFIENY